MTSPTIIHGEPYFLQATGKPVPSRRLLGVIPKGLVLVTRGRFKVPGQRGAVALKPGQAVIRWKPTAAERRSILKLAVFANSASGGAQKALTLKVRR
jgi:hypothetical protein